MGVHWFIIINLQNQCRDKKFMSLNVTNPYIRPYYPAKNCFGKNNSAAVGFTGKALINSDVKRSMGKIGEEIKNADKIVILTHGTPDEDAIGSAAAMKNLISEKYPNKKVDVLIMDKISSKYKCLKDSDDFVYITKDTNIESIKANDYDLAIAVDCRTKEQMKEASAIFDSAKRTVEIDHHPDNENYADVNLVCQSASSASQAILLLANSMKSNKNKDLTSDIYMGLVGDTAGFRYMKKPADVFQDASELTKSGFDERKIYCSAMDYMPKSAVKFYSNVLKNIQYSEDGKIAYVIDDRTLEKEGVSKADANCVISKIVGQVMPNIDGVKVAVKLTERDKGKKGIDTSASIRGNGVVVNDFAQKYGGNGHEYAAGFLVKNKTPQAVVQEVVNYFDKTGKLHED